MARKRTPPLTIPIFDQFPELLDDPPRYGTDNNGAWFIEWKALRRDGNGDIRVVLHAFIPSQVLWSYAIFDEATNTVRHYRGKHGDMKRDELVIIEEGQVP